MEEQFKEKYEVEYQKTIKTFKSIKRMDLPIYTKKFGGEWLYRLRLDQGRIKADRLIISPYYELKESTISYVLGPETEESNRDEWRMALHNLLKYFQEHE
tara:strand:- start:128 stop:427 length:300 start_codon:yes stop_codon:yes gene_type:complete